MLNKSLYISAEYILPKCGLANYLEMLIGALMVSRPQVGIKVKGVGDLWDSHGNIPFDLEESARGSILYQGPLHAFLKKNIKPRIPTPLWKRLFALTDRYHYITYHRQIADWWKQQADQTVCILPHIPLVRAAIPYYKTIMSKNLIWVVHDLHPFYFPEVWNPVALKLCHTILPELARQASHIIVHNNFTRESVTKHLGIGEGKITVVRLPHILDLKTEDIENKDETEILKKNGVRQPYALWASSTTIQHKNHERLIRAWAKVQANYSERIQLVCTGAKQPNWDAISSLLTTLNGDVDVVFTDTVKKTELITILHNAKLAVCPTLFEGGGCGPAMEAAYAGVPVACSDIPQIREQYDNRKDLCYFFDARNEESIAGSVLGLLKDYDTAKEKAFRSQEWVRHRRSWDEVAQEYWKVIERFI